MVACYQKKVQAFDFFSLRTRDSLNIEDEDGLTFLVHQLIDNNFIVAQRLLQRGADINYCNKNGQTALHFCIENNLVEAVS